MRSSRGQGCLYLPGIPWTMHSPAIHRPVHHPGYTLFPTSRAGYAADLRPCTVLTSWALFFGYSLGSLSLALLLCLSC